MRKLLFLATPVATNRPGVVSGPEDLSCFQVTVLTPGGCTISFSGRHLHRSLPGKRAGWSASNHSFRRHMRMSGSSARDVGEANPRAAEPLHGQSAGVAASDPWR